MRERAHAGWALAGALLAALTLSWLASPAGVAARQTADPPPPETADELVARLCGTACHGQPDPSMLSKDQWSNAVELMKSVMKEAAGVEYTPLQMQKVLIYYRSRSLQSLPRLPPDPGPSDLRFEPRPIGGEADPESPPTIANVAVVDVDGDGGDDVLFCDAGAGSVRWIHRDGDGWTEGELAKVTAPARAAVLDHDGDGRRDLVVASLGSLFPSNEPVGRVVLLTNDGEGGYTAETLLEGVGRVADVRPADLDGDGDLDFAVAVFGHLQGGIGWLRRESPGEYSFTWLYQLPGGIHVPIVDLDGDGNLDIVALVAQAREEVVAFLGDGRGGFTTHYVFQAGTPLFGSSGIEVVDLDGDGDLDVLHTNGDSFDLLAQRVPAEALLRPHHGVRWFENRGEMRFERHELASLYGAFGAQAGDVDGDGDLDVVAVSMFNDWSDPGRQSILWLENDGAQRFTAHGIGSDPSHLVTAALGDIDGDGRLDAVTGGMHAFPPFDRLGRVTLWRNLGGTDDP